MRKRKIPQNMPQLDLMSDPFTLQEWNASIILKLVTKRFRTLSQKEKKMLLALSLLIKNKLDPEDYDILFHRLSDPKIIHTLPDNEDSFQETAPIQSRPALTPVKEISSSFSSVESTTIFAEPEDLPFSFD